MGSSEYAKNKGVPATPRDGAPIELVAMQYSILSWLAKLSEAGKISQRSVSVQRGGRAMEVPFADWAGKMKANFERCFWVPAERHEDSQYDVNPKLVNRRGVYKDVYGSADLYTDY
jgi:glycogen debranching enzyme